LAGPYPPLIDYKDPDSAQRSRCRAGHERYGQRNGVTDRLHQPTATAEKRSQGLTTLAQWLRNCETNEMAQTFQQKYAITEEEREALIQMIAYRYIDFVTEGAEDCARRALDQIYEKVDVVNTDTLNLTFNVQQMVTDIIVELGRYRREHQSDPWLHRITIWLRQWFGVNKNAFGD